MTSSPRSAPPTGPVVSSVADAAASLATAVDSLVEADRVICRPVLALSRTTGTGVCETVEGLPPDLLLANLCRRIAATASEIDAYGPDGLLDALDRAILDLRDPDEVERQQTYERTADFQSLQGRLDAA